MFFIFQPYFQPPKRKSIPAQENFFRFLRFSFSFQRHSTPGWHCILSEELPFFDFNSKVEGHVNFSCRAKTFMKPFFPIALGIDATPQKQNRRGGNPMTPIPLKSWLTEKEAAAMTGLSVSTLQKQRCYHRGMPYSKIGRSVRYSINDIQAFMKAHRIQIAAEN